MNIKTLFKNKQQERPHNGVPIATKIYFSMLGCLLILLVFNGLLNNLVLEQYYRRQKEAGMSALFREVNTIYSENDALTDRQTKIEALDLQNQYAILVFDRRAQVLLWSLNGAEKSTDSMHILVFGDLAKAYDAGEYGIRVTREDRSEQGTLVLVGTLSDGSLIEIRSPLQSMRESIAISNRLLLYSGAATLLLSFIILLRLANSLTRPIKELVYVTDGLAQLDFSRRYMRKSRDELGRMGDGINRLSEEMEHTLSEMKTLNAQLQRDNEIKTRQDQLRRDFIANASHELKTPIALIRAYAEGLSDDVSTDAESRKTYCDIIQDEADRMNLLIRKMTSLMQLESGEEELTISRFPIGELLEGVLRNYSILLDQKKIAVTCTCPEELNCWGDAYFIENVVNNYVSNAANHVSEKGEIIVSTDRRTASDGKTHIRVSVFNTGSGIGEEDLQRIWESFYKVDKARSRQYGGTGLGLSVVAAIMRAHDMPYGVENVENGVRFWFELEMA